ncbi:MAG: hypothetical protein QXL51_01010 [Candidatus Aenigmatarchaeota archaeon]
MNECELCINESLVEHKISYKGKEYVFKLRVLPWVKIEELRSNYIIINSRTGITKLKEAEYQMALLKEAIVEGPFKEEEKEVFLSKLKLDVKDELIKIIKEMHELDDETTKN